MYFRSSSRINKNNRDFSGRMCVFQAEDSRSRQRCPAILANISTGKLHLEAAIVRCDGPTSCGFSMPSCRALIALKAEG